MSARKRHTAAITKPQKRKLVEHMKRNQRIACGQFSGPGCNKSIHTFWENVSADLNSCEGAVKNKDQWKKCWSDWKGAVKRQYSALKQSENTIDNCPSAKNPKPLEDLDMEVLEFIMPSMKEGDAYKEESGFPPRDEFENILDEEYCDFDFLSDSSNLDTLGIEEKPMPVHLSIAKERLPVLPSVPQEPTPVLLSIAHKKLPVLPNIPQKGKPANTSITEKRSPVVSQPKIQRTSHFNALEDVRKEVAEQNNQQLNVLNAILASVQNIERKLCNNSSEITTNKNF